jgi:rRNA pseudouridine-1189 N-methylase Emg1 (Nep1/Mra1 family)
MVVTDKQKANLRPAKPGESGNPHGLPKGYVRASTIITKLLKKEMTVEEAGRKMKRPIGEVLWMIAVKDAMDRTVGTSAQGRAIARDSIVSRVEGKAVQILGAMPNQEIHLEINSVEAQI